MKLFKKKKDSQKMRKKGGKKLFVKDKSKIIKAKIITSIDNWMNFNFKKKKEPYKNSSKSKKWNLI